MLMLNRPLPQAVLTCLLSLHDPSAADNFIAAIEDRRLARRDRALWLVKFYAGAIICERHNRRGRCRVTIADTDFCAHRLSRIVERDPIDTSRGESVAQQFIVVADDYTILLRIDPENIKRPWLRDTNSAALADRVAMNARVRTNNLSAGRDDFAGARQSFGLLFSLQISIDEAGVVAIRNETNLLRLFLFSDREVTVARRLARIALGKFAQREQCARKL